MGKRGTKIAISGASGFIGSYLTEYFESAGYRVIPLRRDVLGEDAESRLRELLSGCEVIINLAGAPINHRWTKKYKQILHDSRVLTTRRIVNAINHLEHQPKLFISVSAVGYYPSSECYEEYDLKKGNDFLSDLCEQWEQEARLVSSSVRLAIPRFGVVLSPEGGAFPRMIVPTKWGVSTVLGSGNQSFSWIDIKDLARAMSFIIDQPTLHGVINFVAPEKLTNRLFTQKVAKNFHSLMTVRVPGVFFRLLLGKASSFILNGQCVYPRKLLETGFVFNTPSFDEFCSSLPERAKLPGRQPG